MSIDMVSSFYAGDHLFGVPVTEVQEVLRAGGSTPVPLAPSAVAGLLNVRGQIVTAIDLGTTLGLASSAEQESRANVIVTHDGGVVALVVDKIAGVLDIDDARIEPPPATINGRLKDLIIGVYQLEERLMLVLSVTRVLARIAAEAEVIS